MKCLLADVYGKEKELILVTGSIPAQQAEQLIELATLVRPKQYEVALYLHRGTWNG